VTDGVTDMVDLDALAQAELVRQGEVSPRELVEGAIERIEQVNGEVNAVIHRRYEEALGEADRVDRDAPFAGVPCLTKALNESAGDPAHFGSAWVARSGRRATSDSVMVRRLREAGFVMLGQTSTPEFGVLSVSETRVHGVTRNPWRTDLTPGGSSGGASAAVAAGMVPVAQGGDGGGSIRMPAAFCNLVGLKPTVGRISAGPGAGNRWGHSVPAVVTRTVRDTAAVIDAVAVGSPADPGDVRPLPEDGLLRQVGRDPGRLRIGVMHTAPDHAPQVDDAVRASVLETADLLARLGHDVVDDHPSGMDDPLTLPMFFDALSVTVVQSVDALAREIGPPEPGDLDTVTEHWLRRGREITGVQLADALTWQGCFRARMSSWWEAGFDLLLSPVFATAPKQVSWPWLEPDGIQASVDVLSFTAPFNTTGQPAISVPASITPAGEPLGVQLVAALGREDLLIAVAGQLESERPWSRERPAVFAG
jgi:amidase